MPFDSRYIEAKLALGMILPEEMPAIAWDALEAGMDGLAIRRLASLDKPSGWEADQIIPKFMTETGMARVSRAEASICVARLLARRILSEGLDPLAYARDFEILWIQADYPRVIQEVGLLEEELYMAASTGQSERELREYARGLLLALVSTSE